MQLPDERAHADRPPLTLMDPTSAAWLVHDDLERLAQVVARTLRHAGDVLETKRELGQIDNHRDALHLLARIEALRCQIEHATETLRRIERRDQGTPWLRRSGASGARHPAVSSAIG